MIRAHANGLLAQLGLEGKIPGLDPCTITAAAVMQHRTGIPTRVQMPVVYCQMPRTVTNGPYIVGTRPCGNQLVRDWYAVNPLTGLLLACLWCARNAHRNGEVVHTLIGLDVTS